MADFDWRGMELFDGYLMPKGAGLSNEGKLLESGLCGRADDNLEGYLTGHADYLPIVKTAKQKRLEVGYVVASLCKLESEHGNDLEKWFALGYREIWSFWPWYRALYIYTSPTEYKRVEETEFASPYLTVGKVGGGEKHWKLPLNEIFED